MNKIYYPTIKETLYHEEMANGLQVFLMPKEGFEKTYGLFSTRFGSIDTTFVPIGEQEMITVPDGVAHFLEHKMFDMADGDASDAFARLGASTNAFTSNSRTAYLFSTTKNEEACVNLLLDFVQELNVSQESVEKEKGIINQEIGMYDDNPDWRAYFGSIANLYVKHPVKIDIAGTVETVATIDREILYQCYRTFYHPSNMMLFVVGNIEPEKIMQTVRENQSRKSFEKMPTIKRGKVDEPLDVAKKKEVLAMDVTTSKLYIAMKVPPIENQAKRTRRELLFYVLMDMLFSKSSALRQEWLELGLINDTMSGNFTQERDYAYVQMGGDTNNVEELSHKIHELIRNLPHQAFLEADFERIKKKNIGALIGFFNSPETIANLFSRFYFEGMIMMDLIDTFQSLKFEELQDILCLFDDERTTDFVITPLVK